MLGFSIVLCTYNGASRLRETLGHLGKLVIPDNYLVELILVDNASIDNTVTFASVIWKDLMNPFPITVIQEPRAGKGYAVERGYDAASYSYILTVDDDNWLDSSYLMEAIDIFTAHPDVSVLQGISEAVFETPPPSWLADPRIAKQLVIGGPFEEPGYFPENFFYVWGAGLIIHRADWVELRQRGLSFLTSKLPGKAAGEDSELGLGLTLLGRKAYYSTKLKFKHFMPTGRLTWDKLKQNFEVLGYVSYYMSLYAIVIRGHQQGKAITAFDARRQLAIAWLTHARVLTPKQHVAYWAMPREEYYQLMLAEYYSRLKWIAKLSGHIMQDMQAIQAWIVPLLERSEVGFEWP